MKPIQTNSPHDYLAHVLVQWKQFSKGHGRITKAIKEVLEENVKLREENAHLKRKLAYIHLYTQENSEVEK